MTTYNDVYKPVLVLIGPSGSGKSSIAARLERNLELPFRIVPKYTTRPSRQTEAASPTEDIFIDDATFETMVANQQFMGTVEPFGLAFRYGLPWLVDIKAGFIPLVLLRSFVLDEFMTHYPDAIVYQITVDENTATQRMQARGQSTQDIAARMDSYGKELLAGTKQASRTFINHGDIAQTATKIINAYHKDVSSLL